jgi:hypothetical protein
LYKCVGNAVVGCGWAFHNASLTTRRSRFLSFGCGFAALCLGGLSGSQFLLRFAASLCGFLVLAKPDCMDRSSRKDKEFTAETRRNAEKTLKEIKSSKTPKVLKTLNCEGHNDLLLISSLRSAH